MAIVLRGLIAMAMLVSAALPARAADLARNGSFENPVVASGTYVSFNTGDKIGPWKVVGASGNVAVVNKDFTYCAHTFPAKHGAQFIDLTGTTDTPTGVQQKISTIVGATYSLSFFVGNVYDPGSNCGTTSTVNLFIDSVAVGSFTNSRGMGSSAIDWKKATQTFVAQNATTTIALINGDPGADTANGLDRVSIALVAGP